MLAPASGPPWGLAWRLALGQILSWGLLYYAFTVVAGPLHDDTGWSRTFINVGLSLGLLAWGLAAPLVGAWIQRRGARELMAAASVLGGAALVFLGLAHAPIPYLLAWILLGVAMAGALYEPAFAAVTAAFGSDYRRGIVLITLVGGLASTAFIPLAQIAVDWLGWRQALVALGVVQMVAGGPLHWFGLPRRVRPDPAVGESLRANLGTWWRTLRRDVTEPAFISLAIWFSAHAAAATGLVFLLIPLLQSREVPTATILQAVAIMGPMQVLGRFVLSAYGGNFPAIAVGKWAMAAVLVAVTVLVLAPWNLLSLGLFTALFGLGNGVLTIVRGTAVAEFFGRQRYAELNGALSAPGVLAKAGAPLLMGWAWTAAGSATAVTLGAAMLVVISTGGLWAVGHQAARARPQI